MRRLRRWWWQRVHRHDGEICGACGRSVAHSCPSYWLAPDELWVGVQGGKGGIRCISCFTRDCERRGVFIYWEPMLECFEGGS